MNFIKIFFLSFFIILSSSVYALQFKEERSHHFIIKYDPEVSKSYVYKLEKEAEYLYRKITQEFYLSRSKLWMWGNRAKIYVAKDKEDYLKDFNCQSWSLACVNYRDKIIYTFSLQRNFDSILTHELTHIIFREYIGKAQMPLWLDEGMATYMQYKDTREKKVIISFIKKMIKEGTYIDFSKMQNISSLDSNTSNVELFYYQSFSMIYFLIDRFGRSKFSEFLMYLREGKKFDQAFAKAFRAIDNMQDFERLWKKFYQN